MAFVDNARRAAVTAFVGAFGATGAVYAAGAANAATPPGPGVPWYKIEPPGLLGPRIGDRFGVTGGYGLPAGPTIGSVIGGGVGQGPAPRGPRGYAGLPGAQGAPGYTGTTGATGLTGEPLEPPAPRAPPDRPVLAAHAVYVDGAVRPELAEPPERRALRARRGHRALPASRVLRA